MLKTPINMLGQLEAKEPVALDSHQDVKAVRNKVSRFY